MQKTAYQRKPLRLTLFRGASLLPVLLWPWVFLGSMFFVEDQFAEGALGSAVFFGINSYPLWLMANYKLGTFLYTRRPILAMGLLALPLLLTVVLLGYLVLE